MVDAALQLHGALGYSHDTPLARWYTNTIPAAGRWAGQYTAGELGEVIKAFERDGSTAAACGSDLFT